MAEFEPQQKKSASKTTSPKHFYDEESWKIPTSIQRAWFASGCTTLLISVAKSLIIFSRRSQEYTIGPLTPMARPELPFSDPRSKVSSVTTTIRQQLHAWSHTPRGKLPRLVVALQDSGVILPRAEHAAHHHPPFDNHYCIVSGVWNRFLDNHKIFWAMEMILFFIFGVRPRSWSDFNSK